MSTGTGRVYPQEAPRHRRSHPHRTGQSPTLHSLNARKTLLIIANNEALHTLLQHTTHLQHPTICFKLLCDLFTPTPPPYVHLHSDAIVPGPNPAVLNSPTTLRPAGANHCYTPLRNTSPLILLGSHCNHSAPVPLHSPSTPLFATELSLFSYTI